MTLEFPFNRKNRRRPAQAEQIADALLSTASAQMSSKKLTARVRPRKAKQTSAAVQIQPLEIRLLLAANINLTAWPGVPYLLEASGTGANATLTLKNRTTSATLTSVTVNASDTSVDIIGTTAADDLQIDLSGVYTEASGNITKRIPVALSFTGGAGADSVTFTGNTAVSDALAISAETIIVNSGIRVDSSGTLALNAIANEVALTNSGLTVASTGTNAAAITISGHVSAASVSMTAQTNRTIIATSTAALLSASNTWTDSATITVNGGAKVEGTGNVTLLARRDSTYKATGRSALNDITGDTRIVIGAAGNGSTLSSGGTLSVRAIDNLRAEAVSPEQAIDLGALGFPANIAVAAARNLISGDTKVTITDSIVTQTGSGTTAIEANRQVIAIAESESDSLTYAAIPNGSTVSLNGTYSANHLSGSVQSIIEGGSFTTKSAAVSAQDNATATVKSGLTARTTSFGTAFNTSSLTFGASIAFNMIGGSGLNAALRTVDTLLGTSVTPVTASETLALFDNTIIDVTGSLAVASDSAARTNATVSNAVESNVAGISGATGSAASGIVASNLINSSSTALVKPFDHRSSDGTVTLEVGEKVQVASGHTAGGAINAIYEFIGTAGDRNLSTQNFASIANWKLVTAATTAVSGALSITASDDTAAYSNAKLVSSSTVTNDGGARLLQDLLNLTIDYDHKSSDGTLSLAFGEKVLVVSGSNAGGTVRSVYEYLGVTGSKNLATQDYSNLDLWKPADGTEIIPQGINLTDSSSVSVGGLVVRNDVKSSASAALLNATLTSVGSVDVRAIENATIKATADATVQSSGGSAFGSGASLAVNGVIATNNVLSNASALIQGSSITTNSTSPNTGDVSVVAENTSEIEAINKSIVTAGETAVGATLAFNTIGYAPQNTLFNSIDAIIGTDIGTKTPAKTSAIVVDTMVAAAGDLTVTADSSARISSELSNEATSAASALINASGMSVGMVVSSNMVATDVDAAVKGTATTQSISATNITVASTDDNTITADTTLLSSSTTTNDGGASLVNKLGSDLQQDYI